MLFRSANRIDAKNRVADETGAVARVEQFAVNGYATTQHLKPRLSIWSEGMRDAVARLERAQMKIDVTTHFQRAVPAVAGA